MSLSFSKPPYEATEPAISLHGLGFLQVKLWGNQRLHVWHPDLPRRSCFKHSAIHDHRFAFTSRVLVGTQINHLFRLEQPLLGSGTHITYKHEGPRSQYGNRPWIPDGNFNVVRISKMEINAGEDYTMAPYAYHATEPGGDGIVATLMTKTWEGDDLGAHSTCKIGVTPDVDFDRFQLSEDAMWKVVRQVMETAQ